MLSMMKNLVEKCELIVDVRTGHVWATFRLIGNATLNEIYADIMQWGDAVKGIPFKREDVTVKYIGE